MHIIVHPVSQHTKSRAVSASTTIYGIMLIVLLYFTYIVHNDADWILLRKYIAYIGAITYLT